MITYKLVSRSHPVCRGKCPKKLHPQIRRFWSTRWLWECSGAVLAFDRGELIGFFRYDKRKLRFGRGIMLRAVGTYVLASYRHEGVAQKLWRRAIRKIKPDAIEVVITSRGGAKLVNILRGTHRKLDWKVIKNT